MEKKNLDSSVAHFLKVVFINVLSWDWSSKFGHLNFMPSFVYAYKKEEYIVNVVESSVGWYDKCW